MNFLLNTLEYFSLYERIYSLSITGLDNSGKTTLIHLLHSVHISPTWPKSINIDDVVKIGNYSFILHDLSYYVRKLYQRNVKMADGIVFLFDISDTERFSEAKHEFLHVISEMNSTSSIAVYANKIEKNPNITIDQVNRALGIDQLHTNCIKVFMTSFVQHLNITDGLVWLAKDIEERKHKYCVQLPTVSSIPPQIKDKDHFHDVVIKCFN
jgi:GTPase SAR1 family protein